MATGTGDSAQTLRPADVGLKREIGLIGATWSSETSIIGSGWLLGSFAAAQAIGGAAIIDWVIGAIVALILALIHAELGAMYPVAGGTARFPHLAFGQGAGISFGFFSWLQAVTVPPIEAYAVIHYASYYWHGIYNPNANGGNGNVTHWGFVLEIGLMAVFCALNFIPMRIYNPIYSVITWWKVAIPVLTIIVLFTHFHGANFHAGGGFFPTGTGVKQLFQALPGASIVFAYLGFEQADQLAGEIKNPQRNLPLAIVLSIIIGAVIYILLQVVFIGATPGALLGAKGFAGIAATNPIAVAPFAGLASLASFGWLSGILRLDAWISPAGTGAIYMTSTSRVAYGLSRNRYFPGLFGAVSRRGIPWFGMITAFIFGIVFTFPFPSWHSLVGLVTSASVLMYAAAPLSLGTFRYRLPGAIRPFRLPGAAVIAPIGFVCSSLIIYWSGFETLWKLGVAIVLGYIVIGMYNSDRPEVAKIDWTRSSWIGAYLLGMGIISWQGQFGPDNTYRIPFWWDIGIVAVFSLVIYYWAIYKGSQTTVEIEARIAEQAAPAEEAQEPAPA
jgi:amino acid transporter